MVSPLLDADKMRTDRLEAQEAARHPLILRLFLQHRAAAQKLTIRPPWNRAEAGSGDEEIALTHTLLFFEGSVLAVHLREDERRLNK